MSKIDDAIAAVVRLPGLLEELVGDVREIVTRNGVPINGAEARPVGGQSKLWSSSTRVAGFSLRETTGGAGATVILWDGDTNGDPLLPITLSAGGSLLSWFGPRGVSFPNGVFAQVVSGSVQGSVFAFAGQAVWR